MKFVNSVGLVGGVSDQDVLYDSVSRLSFRLQEGDSSADIRCVHWHSASRLPPMACRWM